MAVAGLATTLVLGVALRANTTGVAPDTWFQRLTRGLSAQPGQPDFHYRSFWALTRAQRLGTPPLVIVVAAAAAVVVAAFADSRRQAAFAAAAPFVALALAAGSAELVLKPLFDRRMAGNLGVQTYPSVHSVGTAALAGCVAVLLGPLTARGGRSVRTLVALAFAALSLGVGLDMAVLRSHFLSDVVGGWCWGGAWAVLISVWVRARTARGRTAQPVGSP